jgi:hypothetical protein
MDQLIAAIAIPAKLAWAFANTTFFTSLASGFAGAFAGATAAYWLERRTRKRQELVQEVRNVNAFIMTAFNIFLTFMRLKDQCTKPLKEDYNNFCTALSAATPENPCTLSADFQSIDPVHIPIDILRQQVFEKISGDGNTQAWMIYLEEASNKLKLSLEQRNDWLRDRRGFSANKTSNRDGWVMVMKEYAGHPLHDGMVDYTYQSLIEAIAMENDDCIRFSYELITSLQTYGNRLIGKKKKRKLKINEVNFSKGMTNIPQDQKYDDIKKMYRDGDQ